MTGKHNSKVRTMVGVRPLWVLLCLTAFLGSGCTSNTSSSTGVDSAPTVPSVKTERELLLEIERRFDNPEAHYELAAFYHRARLWTKAAYQYNIALSQRPGLLAAQAGLVKLHIDENEPAKAEQFANGYIRQVARNTRDTLKLGWEFENLGMSDYALRCFQQALAESPDSFDANKQMGLYYLGKGDNDRARRYLGRSFELNPRQPDVAGQLGRLGVVVESPQPEPEPDKGARK
jgi:tetratricopeptide (TPR) repeat protein